MINFIILGDTLHLWNVYRGKWLGAYWQFLGIDVLPSVTWGDERIEYDTYFDGIEVGSPVVVSSRGVLSYDVFMWGYEAMKRIIKPEVIYLFGKNIANDNVEILQNEVYDY